MQLRSGYKTTIINSIHNDWVNIKNKCRTTVRKDYTANVPNSEFKRKLLISEHSPIRLLEVDWSWKNIKYWVSTEWSRHKFEKFISSQRNDRQDEYDRNKAPQDAPVNFDGCANAQNLIDAMRKRLCHQATPEARELAESLKVAIKNSGEEELADVLVPNCVYRCGCPEFTSCGIWKLIENACTKEDLTDVRKRYKVYNDMIYSNFNNKEGA